MHERSRNQLGGRTGSGLEHEILHVVRGEDYYPLPLVSVLDKRGTAGVVDGKRRGAPVHMPVILRGLRQPVSVDPIEARSREELIELSDDIEASDKEILVADLPDLARETPRTQVAATRFRKIAAKLGGSVASALRDIAVDVASEAASKSSNSSGAILVFGSRRKIHCVSRKYTCAWSDSAVVNPHRNRTVSFGMVHEL
jgi:hypothetical protein